MSNHRTSITLDFDSPEEAAEFLAWYNGNTDAPPAPDDKPEKTPPKKAAKKTSGKGKAKTPPPEKTEETSEEETEGEDEVTLDLLRETFQGLVKAGKRPEALKLLKKYKVAKIHDVAEDDMAAMYQEALALRNEETQEEEDDSDPFAD